MALKKFYVGVKGIIKEQRGYLVLKAAKGHMDIPGGRIDDNEDFIDTLKRELSEELPGINVNKIEELQGAFRLPKDIDEDTSLVLLYFLVDAELPETVELSDEHESYAWVNTLEDIPEGLNPSIDTILRRLIKA